MTDGQTLGRVDIHSERPIYWRQSGYALVWPDFERLVVALLARCAASRLAKRLDSFKIELKSILHPECQHALAAKAKQGENVWNSK